LEGNAFNNGWNLLRFDLNSKTTVGSPVSTSITYCKVLFTTDGTAQTEVRVNGIICRLGKLMEIVYYSKYLFSDSLNVWKETVTDESDRVNLDTETYQLFFNQVCYLTSQQLQGANALVYDSKFFKDSYDQGVARYRAMYKSEIQKPQAKYYRMVKATFRRYFNRRMNY
jgi:hypothetical protein